MILSPQKKNILHHDHGQGEPDPESAQMTARYSRGMHDQNLKPQLDNRGISQTITVSVPCTLLSLVFYGLLPGVGNYLTQSLHGGEESTLGTTL